MKKKLFLTILICLLSITGPIAANAQSNESTVNDVKIQLKKQQAIIGQKEKEKQAVNDEIREIQDEIQSLHEMISINQEQLTKIQQKILDTKTIIEQKKEKIVQLEEQIFNRQDVMEKRLVALQHQDKTKIYLEAIFNSESFADLIGRLSAVATFMNADKEILNEQKEDLEQIEKEKKEIDAKEKVLEESQKALVEKQTELQQNVKKRQIALATMQAKLQKIASQLALADKEKAAIQKQLKEIQTKMNRENRAAAKLTNATPRVTKVETKPDAAGKELYVTATAYSYEETNDNGYISKLGYNITNPNLKLIAVDPSVIPLGSKVWVEGYGTAIAGDTGGAIHGYRIDVLMHSKSAALNWGRRTVKVIILD